MRLVLSYPPSVNRIWRVFGGRVIKSKEGRAYAAKAALEAKAQGAAPQAGSLEVWVDVYRPQRRGDLDNTLKAVFDCLNGVAWEDDGQIIGIHAHRFDSKERPRVEVEVREAGHD
jgi:crossover junction endodeoxyribonuclease RusA